MNELIQELIKKLLEPDVLNQVFGTGLLVLYLLGRITKNQFIAEQMKIKGLIEKDDAKKQMVQNVLGPGNLIFEILNLLPIINTKIPAIQLSVPDILQRICWSSIGLIGDILHNFPGIGTNINKMNLDKTQGTK